MLRYPYYRSTLASYILLILYILWSLSQNLRRPSMYQVNLESGTFKIKLTCLFLSLLSTRGVLSTVQSKIGHKVTFSQLCHRNLFPLHRTVSCMFVSVLIYPLVADRTTRTWETRRIRSRGWGKLTEPGRCDDNFDPSLDFIFVVSLLIFHLCVIPLSLQSFFLYTVVIKEERVIKTNSLSGINIEWYTYHHITWKDTLHYSLSSDLESNTSTVR